MECPICAAIADSSATAIDGISVVCHVREFDVARSVIASGQLQNLALEERANVLNMTRRSAEPGGRAMITPTCLLRRTVPWATRRPARSLPRCGAKARSAGRGTLSATGVANCRCH